MEILSRIRKNMQRRLKGVISNIKNKIINFLGLFDCVMIDKFYAKAIKHFTC